MLDLVCDKKIRGTIVATEVFKINKDDRVKVIYGTNNSEHLGVQSTYKRLGNYSIYAAKMGIKTFACEPEMLNLSLLYENIFLNNIEHLCTPIPFALHDKTMLEIFYLKDLSKSDALHSIGEKSYLLENPEDSTKSIDAFTITLDDLVKIYALPNPTKLK